MNDSIIIGSVAAKFWYPDYREPIKDIDILCGSRYDITKGNIFIPEKYNHLRVEYQTHSAADYILARHEHGLFMNPDELFTLKVSHAHWDVKFDKTIHDILFFQKKGCYFDKEMYSKLLPVWGSIHGSKKQINLNVPVEEFFTSSVQRKYNHEWLHDLIKYNSRPMHEYIRKDLSKALCSEELFNDLSFQDQINTALEKIQVLGIERCRLNKTSSRLDIIKALYKGHKLVCTSVAKGWFSLFCILHTRHLMIYNKEDTVNRLMVLLKNID